MTPEEFKRNADTIVSAYKKIVLFRIFVVLPVAILVVLGVIALVYYFGPQ